MKAQLQKGVTHVCTMYIVEAYPRERIISKRGGGRERWIQRGGGEVEGPKSFRGRRREEREREREREIGVCIGRGTQRYDVWNTTYS